MRAIWILFIFIFLAVLLVVSPARGAKAPAYGKVRTPMFPGMRWLYTRVTKVLISASSEDTGGDPLLAADLGSESLLGASNYATALGNGRLFVEVSPWAELTVFRWPNPTFSDQLRYVTRKAFESGFTSAPVRQGKDASCQDWKRYGRPIEVCRGLGSAAGVLTGSGQVVWSDDPVWTSSRSFSPLDSTVLTTRLEGPVVLESTDFIHPELDLMVRTYKIEGDATRFFYHSTFAPFLAEPGQYTDRDPAAAGFASLYLPADDLILHFYPRERDAARLDSLFENSPAPEDIDRAFPGGGVFIAWAMAEGGTGWQVGPDPCLYNPRQGDPQPGRADAADGSLSGHSGWPGKVDAALSRDLGPGAGQVTVLIAVADSAAKSVQLIREARTRGADALRQEAVDHWLEVSGRISVPASDDPVTTRVIKRSVLNLIQGQDEGRLYCGLGVPAAGLQLRLAAGRRFFRFGS